MSSIALVIAAHHPPPILGRCGVAATSVTSAITDLSADVAVKNHLNTGALITFLADGVDIFIAFNNASSGTIDDTANTGATSCIKLPANQFVPIQFVKGYTFLLTKAASGTPKLRYWVSGINDSKDAGK